MSPINICHQIFYFSQDVHAHELSSCSVEKCIAKLNYLIMYEISKSFFLEKSLCLETGSIKKAQNLVENNVKVSRKHERFLL